RDCEAGCTRNKTQSCLRFQLVHLIDHAVDLERQGVALTADIAVETQQALDAFSHAALPGNRKPHRFERVELAAVAVRRYFSAADAADTISKKNQAPAGSDARIELPQRARRRI